MENDFVSHQLPKGHEEPSRMLDLDNKLTGFMSPVRHIPHVYKSQIWSAYNS